MSKGRATGRSVLKTLYELSDKLQELVDDAVSQNIEAGKSIEAAWGKIIEDRSAGLTKIAEVGTELIELQGVVSRRLAGVPKGRAGDLTKIPAAVARARALVESGLPSLSIDTDGFLRSIVESLDVVEDGEDGDFDIEIGADDPEDGIELLIETLPDEGAGDGDTSPPPGGSPDI